MFGSFLHILGPKFLSNYQQCGPIKSSWYIIGERKISRGESVIKISKRGPFLYGLNGRQSERVAGLTEGTVMKDFLKVAVVESG